MSGRSSAKETLDRWRKGGKNCEDSERPEDKCGKGRDCGALRRSDKTKKGLPPKQSYCDKPKCHCKKKAPKESKSKKRSCSPKKKRSSSPKKKSESQKHSAPRKGCGCESCRGGGGKKKSKGCAPKKSKGCAPKKSHKKSKGGCDPCGDKPKPCEEKKKKCEPCPQIYTPQQIFKNLKGAVVAIHAESILYTTPEGSPPFPPPTDYQSYYREATGVFHGDCPYVLTSAEAVLIPPTLLNGRSRWPLVDPTTTQNGTQPNATTRASRVFVDVYNVNGGGESYTYEADIIGISGHANIAVLRISCSKAWNVNNPPIKRGCQPTTHWGNSRAYKPGEPAYLIGSGTNNPNTFLRHDHAIKFYEGVIGANRHLDNMGANNAEIIEVTGAGVYAQATGLPIFDKFGSLIGIQTTGVQYFVDSGGSPLNSLPYFFDAQRWVTGNSEFYLKPIVRSLIAGPQNGTSDQFTKFVADYAGSYVVRRWSYLGIAWELLTGQAYDTTFGLGGRVIRIDPVTGAFLNTPRCKEIVGIQVLSLAGDAINSPYNIPGVGTLVNPPTLPNSPLLGVVNVGDIITHIAKCDLGSLKGQIAPGLALRDFAPGSRIEINFRPQTNLDNASTTTVVTQELPGYYDYPLYKLATSVPPPVLQSILPTSTFRPPI